MANEIRAGIRRLFGLAIRDRGRAHAQLDEEIQFHLEQRVEQLIASGMTPDAAREEALRRFGDVHDATHQLHASLDRRERVLTWHERLAAALRDVRYVARGLRAKPGFTAAIVLMLALGIGANAAMFQIVDRLLFRSPAFLSHPERMHHVYLAATYSGTAFNRQNIQYKRYLDLSQNTRSFSHTAAVWYPLRAVGVGGETRERRIAGISASTFALFDARPVLGRFFTEDEDTPPAGAEVAVLSHAYWSDRYGRDPKVLGRQIQVGSRSLTIIGVAPAGFRATATMTPAVFVPITTMGYWMLFRPGNADYYTNYTINWMEMLVERKPAVSLTQATADLTTAFQRSYQAQADMQPSTPPMTLSKPHAVLGPVLLERGPNGGATSKVATWLEGVAAIVLLIACANIANLLLARALRRRREIAVRLALGIGRGRLLAQLLMESVALAVCGGGAGLLIAQWGGAFLRAEFLAQTDPQGVLGDERTTLFAMVVAAAVGILTGLAPALYALRTNVAGALKSGVREGSYHRSPLRAGLLIVQAGLSVVLLVGAGLFIKSFRAVDHLRLGYDADRLLYVSPIMRGVELDSAAAVALREGLLARVQALPGVVSATRASTVPFYSDWDEPIFVPGMDTAAINKMGNFAIQTGSADYFSTVGTRILRGRGFTAADRAGGPLVMVVSEAMARALWPGQDPLGKCVRVGSDTLPCREIIGVAENTHTQDLRDDPGLQYYMPTLQAEPEGGHLFIRVRGSPERTAPLIRAELQKMMPGISYVNVDPLSDRVDPQRSSWRLGALMFTLFGALALALAAFGLYSVMAYNVAQRSHEMGVRIALGARTGRVLGLILRDGMRLALVGVALGLGFALWAAKWIAPLLYEQSPRDPVVYAGVITVLLVTAAVASLAPAVRATRVDPASALRVE